MIQFRRRTVALALVAFLAFAGLATVSFVRTLAPAEAGAGFNDTPPWAADQINWLADNGIANGFDDGSFGPNKNITRAQAAFWFANYNNSIEIVTKPVAAGSMASLGTATTAVACPSGKHAIAGGVQTSGQLQTNTESYPSGNSWVFTWRNFTGGTAARAAATIYATCVPDTIP